MRHQGGDSPSIWSTWICRVRERLRPRRGSGDRHEALAAQDEDGPDGFTVTGMEQRTMFIKDLPMQLTDGAARVRQAGFTRVAAPRRDEEGGAWGMRERRFPLEKGPGHETGISAASTSRQRFPKNQEEVMAAQTVLAARRAIARRTWLVVLTTLIGIMGFATPASAGTFIARTATINPNPAVWEPITPPLYATRSGENVYIRFDRTPEALLVRWVKCGYSSTQGAPSSVGRSAIFIRQNSDFGGAVGSNFRNGTCVRLWARAAHQLSYRPSYPIEAYFGSSYRY